MSHFSHCVKAFCLLCQKKLLKAILEHGLSKTGTYQKSTYTRLQDLVQQKSTLDKVDLEVNMVEGERLLSNEK